MPASPEDAAGRLADVLVFTRTTGYRHDSIPAGVAALRELGEEQGFSVEATEDPSVFTGASLAGRGAVVFLSTSGTVLTDTGRAALLEWTGAGGGFVGVHAAACTEYDWPEYGGLLGARFAGHPPFQPGTVLVTDPDHPATAHLPQKWHRQDEWYEFRSRPRASLWVLASADESSYQGGTMGADHPLVWCGGHGAGRVFYTALGHSESAYAEADFRRHLLGGLRWAARQG